METTVDHNYCRLCAVLCPNSNLIDLASDSKKREEITKKLTRLCIAREWDHTMLPKTVCFTCDINLNNAFAFVISADQARDELNNMFLSGRIKSESNEDLGQASQNVVFKVEHTSSDGFYDEEPSEDNDVEGLIKSESSNMEFDDNSVTKITNKDDKLKEIEMDSKKMLSGTRSNKKIDILSECSEDAELDLESLSNQRKLTWEDYVWTCTFCPQNYLTFTSLKAHSLEDHNCCNSFRCSECGIRKFRLDKFMNHVAKHHPFLRTSCHLCLTTFPSTKDFKVHMYSVHYKKTDYLCEGCNSKFITASDLAKHSKVYFNQSNQKTSIPMVDKLSDYDKLKCLKCHKVFKLRCMLRRHVIANHIDRKVEHVCDKCGKGFLEKGNLIEHVRRHEKARPFPCEICKGAYKTKKQLREHVLTHAAEKPFSCEECGRCFRLKNQLKSHQLIHTNELPHSCTLCDKAFRSKYRLKQHQHQHTGDKPYSCEICKQSFANKPNCYKHMKRIHNLDMTRKKRTPDGTFPINPDTGEIIKVQTTTEIMKWKEQVLNSKKKRKSKAEIDQEQEDLGNSSQY